MFKVRNISFFSSFSSHDKLFPLRFNSEWLSSPSVIRVKGSPSQRGFLICISSTVAVLDLSVGIMLSLPLVFYYSNGHI